MKLLKIYSDEEGLVTAFAESRIGGRRENQDSYGWQDTARGYLVTVCDGMGGGPSGKMASDIAVKEIIAGVCESPADETECNVLIKAVRRANIAIIEAGNRHPECKGMGTTATVLLVTPRAAYVAHVGDSRVYQLRGRRKVFRTFDHSMVFEMVSQGIISEEQARLSAQSNIISRALGVKADVAVDVAELPYERGDRFMLCSDGIHGTMPERDLLRLLTGRHSSLGTIVDNVATIVDTLGHDTGGQHDNLTIAMIETKANSTLKPKMSRQHRYIMACLALLLAVSVALNIVQYSRAPRAAAVSPDSTTVVKKDSAKATPAATLSPDKGKDGNEKKR